MTVIQAIDEVKMNVRMLRNMWSSNLGLLKIIYECLPDEIPLVKKPNSFLQFKTTTDIKVQILKIMKSMSLAFPDEEMIARFVKEMENK